MITVVDASVAIKWFVNEKQGKAKALAVLDTIKNTPHTFAVPELFFNEMLSVLCRLESEPTAVVDYMIILQNLGLERIGNGAALFAKAIELAMKYKISGYDAIYAASASLIRGVWLTADAVAYKRLSSLGIVRLLHE